MNIFVKAKERKTLRLNYFDEYCITNQFQQSNSSFLFRTQNPFLIRNNTFKYNQAKETGGAMDLDFINAQNQMAGLFYKIDTNITDNKNQQIISQVLALADNIFISNTAQLAGSVLRVNGLNTSDAVSAGSCLQIKQILLLSNQYINNSVFFLDQYLAYDKDCSSFSCNSSEVLCQCIYGEQLKHNPSNGAYFCELCQPGTYMNQSAAWNGLTQQCSACAAGFTCEGGHLDLQLNAGYWSYGGLQSRGNRQSNVSYLCKNLNQRKNDICMGYKACTKTAVNECNQTTLCQKNYTGVACSACNEQYNYFAYRINQCQQCEKTYITSLKIASVVIFIVAMLGISVSSIVYSEESSLKIKALKLGFDYFIAKRDCIAPLLRILMNYFQMISLFFYLNLELPSEGFTSLVFITSFGQPLKTLTSECLLKDLKPEWLGNREFFLLAEFFISLIFIASVAIIQAIAIIIFNKIKKRKIFKYTELIISNIIFLFLYFQPTLIYSSFSFLTCRQLASQKWLIGNTLINCDKYFRSAQNILLPLLIFLLQFIIPFLLLIIVIRHRGNFNNYFESQSFTYKIGYLYIGYKEYCFYWEFVKISVRIIIFSLFIFLFDYNIQKCCITVLLLLGYTWLAQWFEPNDNFIVRKCELYSQIVLIASFICLLMLEEKLNVKAVQYVVIAIIIAINLVFLIFIIAKMTQYLWFRLLFKLSKVKYINKKCSCLLKFERRVRNKKIAIINWSLLRNRRKEVVKSLVNESSQKSQEDDQTLMQDQAREDLRRQLSRIKIAQKQRSHLRNINQSNSEQSEIFENDLESQLLDSQQLEEEK